MWYLFLIEVVKITKLKMFIIFRLRNCSEYLYTFLCKTTFFAKYLPDLSSKPE